MRAANHKLQAANSGFTLIETLIYTMMVGVVVGSLLLIVYNMIISREWLDRSLSLTENKKFLMQKIAWVLQSQSAINTPLPGASSGTLSVNKVGGSENPIVVDTASNTMRVASGGGSPIPLTTGDITARNMSFEHASTTSYEWIRFTGTLENSAGSTTIDYTYPIR